ncbi:MAG: hypothetical protein ACRC8K_07330 [Waterburya sp.]
MKTGKLFNQKQLLAISGLTRNQYRQLQKYNLLNNNTNPLRYSLSEVIYCRLIVKLREHYSLQKIRKFLYSCDTYLNNLVSLDYGVIEYKNDIAEELSMRYFKPEIIKKIEEVYIYHEQKKIIDDCGELYINCCYVNVKKIRKELIIRAKEYQLDSIEEKFKIA